VKIFIDDDEKIKRVTKPFRNEDLFPLLNRIERQPPNFPPAISTLRLCALA
jgi:hypothetical protein